MHQVMAFVCVVAGLVVGGRGWTSEALGSGEGCRVGWGPWWQIESSTYGPFAAWDPDGAGPLRTHLIDRDPDTRVLRLFEINTRVWRTPLEFGLPELVESLQVLSDGSLLVTTPAVETDGLVAQSLYRVTNGQSNLLGVFEGLTTNLAYSGSQFFIESRELSTGELATGGAFTRVNGQSIAGIALWNGSAWRAIGDATVLRARPYLAGPRGTLALHGVVRVDEPDRQIRGADFLWNGTSLSEKVPWPSGEALSPGRVVPGPSWTLLRWGMTPSGVPRVIQWDGDQWRDMQLPPAVTSTASWIDVATLPGGRVLVASYSPGAVWIRRTSGEWMMAAQSSTNAISFGVVGDIDEGGIWVSGVSQIDDARLDGVGVWREGAGWTPVFPRLSVTNAVATDDGGMIVAGPFTHVDGSRVNGLVRYLERNFAGVGGGLVGSPGLWAPQVLQLGTLPGGQLLVGGRFRFAGGQPANGVASWDGRRWTGYPLAPGSQVTSVQAFRDGAIIARGSLAIPEGGFDNAQRWMGTGWETFEAPGSILVDALADGLLAVGWPRAPGPVSGFGVWQQSGGAWRDLRVNPVEDRIFRGAWGGPGNRVVFGFAKPNGPNLAELRWLRGRELFPIALPFEDRNLKVFGFLPGGQLLVGLQISAGRSEALYIVGDRQVNRLATFSGIDSTIGQISTVTGLTGGEVVVTGAFKTVDGVKVPGGAAVFRSACRCGRADVAGGTLGWGADGELTAEDIVEFVAWFSAGDRRADIAGPGGMRERDGELTADDLVAFCAAFVEGC